MTTRTATLVYVSSDANSNKFYRLDLDASGVVTKTYGRVGAAGVVGTESTGDYGFSKILNAKLRKGYREVAVAAETVTPSAVTATANKNLNVIAHAGLTSGVAATNAVIAKLIKRICAANAHNIFETSGGLITVDTAGRVRTPLGLVTSASIHSAQILLDDMALCTGEARRKLL